MTMTRPARRSFFIDDLLVICLRGSRARLLPRRATRERCEYARVARGEGKPTRQIPPERVTRYEERSGSVRGLGSTEGCCCSRSSETSHRPPADPHCAGPDLQSGGDELAGTGTRIGSADRAPAMIYAGAITAMTASTVFAGFSRPFVCVGQYGIAIGFLQENGRMNSGELGLTTSCRPMLSCSASSR